MILYTSTIFVNESVVSDDYVVLTQDLLRHIDYLVCSTTGKDGVRRGYSHMNVLKECVNSNGKDPMAN